MTNSLLLAVPLLLALEGVDAGVRGDAQNQRRLPGKGNTVLSTEVAYPNLDGADSGQYTSDTRIGSGAKSYYYDGNPNCESFGYDFGIKIDSGCPYNYNQFTSFGNNGLELTNQVTDTCNPSPLDLGDFKAVCTGDNKVTLTLPQQDHVVIMKGSNKGVIYSELDGTITLDVGQYTKNNGQQWIPAISHIEFCFNCGDTVVAETTPPPPPATTDPPPAPEEPETAADPEACAAVDETLFPMTPNDLTDLSKTTYGVKHMCGDNQGSCIPDCDDPGQTASFQGQDLRKANGDCFRINICHGTAGGGPGVYKWNKITVGRSESSNGQLPGHASYNHNTYDGTGKLPDYFPLSSVPNPNGAGKYYGFIDEGCNFIPHPCEPEPEPEDECGPDVQCPTPTCDADATFACDTFICEGGKCVEPPPRCNDDRLYCEDGSTWVDRDINLNCDFPPLDCPTTTVAPPTTTVAPPATTVAPPATTVAPPTPPTTDDPMTTASPPGSKGDPHFKTHGGEMFDFHGGCDLVLVDNPGYKNGLGLTIHVRTKIETWWSYIESAVVKIGEDSFEIQMNQFYKNGEALDMSTVTEEATHDEISGHLLRYKKKGENIEALIYTGNGENLKMKTYKGFVTVQVGEAENGTMYQGSHGMLGRFPDGARLGRDGATLIEDVNAFGFEWQVLPSEPKLFHSYDDAWVVPAGQKCAMPEETEAKLSLRRRRLESGMPMDEIEMACAHVKDADDHKACIYDVMATQDASMAGAW